jgi:hypothetical protein
MRKTLLLTLLIPTTAVAQIVYTDIDPDSTVTATHEQISRSYFLDIDNNDSHEFELRYFNPSPGTHTAVEVHQNWSGEQQLLIDNSNRAGALNQGDEISASAINWGSASKLSNAWLTGADRYIGIRFRKDGAWHYGWARLSVPSNLSSFTIKDYAYNSVADEPIICGSTSGTGIKAVQVAQWSLSPNPAANFLNIHRSDAGKPVRLVVVDMKGSVQSTSEMNAGTASMPLDVGKLAAGQYFLQACDTHGHLISSSRFIKP